MQPAKTHTCKKCGETKPLTAEFFQPSAETRSGFRNVCRACINARRNEWHQRRPRRPRPTFQRTCHYCGKVYTARGNRAKYCSTICRERARGRKMTYKVEFETTCHVCGASFIATGTRAMYCSPTCYYRARSRKAKGFPLADANQPYRNCPVCGRSFPYTGRMDYCSKGCSEKGHYRQRRGLPLADDEQPSVKPKTCLVCGKEFLRPGHPTSRYCCEEHQDLARSRRYHGQDPADVRRKCEWCGKEFTTSPGGRFRFCCENHRKRAYLPELRAKLVKALGGSCSCCGEDDHVVLTVHHVGGGGNVHREETGIQYYLYNDMLNDPELLTKYQLLCRNCHRGVHSNGGLCPHERPDTDDQGPTCVRCGATAAPSIPLCAGCFEEVRAGHGGSIRNLRACLACEAAIEPGRRGVRYLYTTCRKDRRKHIAQKSRLDRRRKALSHYGGSPPVCAHCGETILSFLALDHIEPVRADIRNEQGSGDNLVGWVTKHEYPDGFQVLCHNCNIRKGPVPHQRRGELPSTSHVRPESEAS